jgi:hypothetical protein
VNLEETISLTRKLFELRDAALRARWHPHLGSSPLPTAESPGQPAPTRAPAAGQRHLGLQRIPNSPSWEVEYELECLLNRALLVKRQVPDSVAASASVNSADHLAQDLRCLAVQRDLRVEAGRECRARSRTYDDSR